METLHRSPPANRFKIWILCQSHKRVAWKTNFEHIFNICYHIPYLCVQICLMVSFIRVLWCLLWRKVPHSTFSPNINKVFTKLSFLVYHRMIFLPNLGLAVFSTFSRFFNENLYVSIMITAILAYFNKIRGFIHSLLKHSKFPMNNDLKFWIPVHVWATSRKRRRIYC